MPVFAITPAKGKSLSQIVETDVGMVIQPKGRINQAVETDTARSIIWTPRRLVTSVTETDQARGIQALRGKRIADPALESDTASQFLPFKRGDINSIWAVLSGDALIALFEVAFAKASPTVLLENRTEQLIVTEERLLFEEGEELIVFEEVKPNA